MKYMKTFFDDHGGVHNYRSGLSGNLYLKAEFKNWMKRQRKFNGDFYASGTITAYTNALKNSTAKLNLNLNLNVPQPTYFITLR